MAKPTATSVLSRMVDMEHGHIPKKLFQLLYGPPGGGKTVLAMAIAQKIRGKGRILYIDSGDGWVSLDNHKPLKRNASRYPLQEASDLAVIADAVKRQAKGFEDFTVVIIDEASSIAEDIIMRHMRERLGLSEDEVPSSTPKWDDYGPAQYAITQALRKFHGVPNLHIIMIAHVKDETDDEGNIILTRPGFKPGTYADLNKIIHHTGYVQARARKKSDTVEYERFVQSLPTTLLGAKTRIGGLGLRDDFGTVTKIVADWVKGDAAEADEDVEVSEDPNDASEERRALK